MKWLVLLGGIVFSGLLIFTDALEPVVFFILTGHIAIINLTIPPLAMLLFWILIVPVSLIFYSSASHSFWKIIEFIGEKDQQRINRQAKLARSTRLSRSLRLILVAVILQMAEELPKKPASKPKPSFRRRFLALPS